MAAQRLPTDAEMTKVVEAIESDLSNDEAVAKVREITGWPGWQAAEWTLVGRYGYFDEIPPGVAEGEEWS